METGNLPATYLTPEALYSEDIFRPVMMWKLPSHLRWEYSNRFERRVSEVVLAQIGGKVVSQTEGFDPGMDIVWDTPFGLVNVEIKTSAGRKGFIEAGRYDFTQSGLSSTKSNLYLHISVDNPHTEDPFDLRRKVKVRLYATWYLQQKYMEAIDAGKEVVIPPDNNGPGARGFYLKSFDNMHCYVGDLLGQVNQYGDVLYDLSVWTKTHSSVLRELRSIMIGVQKHDPNYTYEHKDFE